MSLLHVQINRENQMDPKHAAYRKLRGLPPGEWETPVAQRALEGQLQAMANDAACRTSGECVASGRRTDSIVKAVKASLSGKAEVRKAGSQAKHTDISSSDLDLWVGVGDAGVSRAQRKNLRDNLVSMLTKGGLKPTRVVLRETSVRLEYKKGHVDIVFDKVNEKVHSKPMPRLKNNPKARAAVRLIKEGCPQKLKGDAIEKKVIAAQQQKKGQRIQELIVVALGLLATESQVKQCVAYLNSQLTGGVRVQL